MREALSPGARRLIIWLVVCVPLVVAVAGVVVCAVALPGCTACHNQPAFVAGTSSTAHRAVACVECHVGDTIVDRAAFGSREFFGMVLPIASARGRELARPTDDRCKACHKRISPGVVTANGISIDHSLCGKGATCTDCHSATGHGKADTWVRTYDMDTCLVCHVENGRTACDLCHKGKTAADRVTTGVFATTHGKDWRKTHGMGKASTCVVCHTAADCTECHGVGLPHDRSFLKAHPQVAKSADARCSTCHDTAFCADCHGIEMPHPKGFVRRHSTAADRTPALCRRCHADSDCVDCHVKHVHPGGAIGTLDRGATGGK